MGSKERKERYTKTMRERILKAAMALFAKKGYEHVSMRRIAKKIEYCPATIYRYFKNKEDIMLQLELSQSAASRHLTQLTATGYLEERRCEGAKCYTLSPERVENTLRAVAAFLEIND